MKDFDEGGKLWFGPFLTYVVRKPEDIQIILNSDDCQDKPLFFYRELFEYGLIVMNGDEYKVHRKATAPLYTLKSLRNFVPQFDGVMNKFLVDFDSNLKLETFDLVRDTMDFALNGNLVTFFGVHMEKKLRVEFLNQSIM